MAMELLENPQPTRQRNRKSGSDNCPLSSILDIVPLVRKFTISFMQFQKPSLVTIWENNNSLVLSKWIALIVFELFFAVLISFIVEINVSNVLLLISFICCDCVANSRCNLSNLSQSSCSDNMIFSFCLICCLILFKRYNIDIMAKIATASQKRNRYAFALALASWISARFLLWMASADLSFVCKEFISSDPEISWAFNELNVARW